MRRFLFIALLILSFAARAETDEQTGSDVPTSPDFTLLVLPANWTTQIPPTGPVNAPERFQTLHCGQRIALGLLTRNADHMTTREGVTAHVRFSMSRGGVKELPGLPVATVRQIKAEGADFALQMLQAAGISAADQEKTRQATAAMSLAVIPVDWAIPTLDPLCDLEISVHLSGGPNADSAGSIRLPVRPAGDWLSDPPITNEEFGRFLNRYHDDLPPGRLVSLFAATAQDHRLKAASVRTFFALALRANPAARDTAISLYSSLESEAQAALLWTLRLAGEELEPLFPTLPAAVVDRFENVAPLSDPRLFPSLRDPVERDTLSQMGHQMDRCWSGWMATGDSSYLRPIVDLLAGAPDFPVYRAWQEAGGGAKGLTARAARGLLYQIAGWSIGSFQRSDPRVADWLSFWMNDPSVPALVRSEIASLPANPAFRRQ
jgi:hypothetical protein